MLLLVTLSSTEAGSIKHVLLLSGSCRRPPAKAKKSPVGNWLSFFHLGKSQSVSKRKLKRHPSEPNEIKSIALPGEITVTQNVKPAFMKLSVSTSDLDSWKCCQRLGFILLLKAILL